MSLLVMLPTGVLSGIEITTLPSTEVEPFVTVFTCTVTESTTGVS